VIAALVEVVVLQALLKVGEDAVVVGTAVRMLLELRQGDLWVEVLKPATVELHDRSGAV
jgi:hypothetical protein